MSLVRRMMRDRVGLVIVTVTVAVFLGPLLQVEVAVAGTWNPALGWDFECHSNTHPSLTGLTDAQVRLELQQVNSAFAAHGYAAPQHHAYPYGDYDSSVKGIVSQYRKTGRTVWGQMMNYPVTDWYEMMAAQLISTTSWNEIAAWVNNCITRKALLHIFTHDVSSNPSQWGCKPAILVQLLDYLVQKRNAGQLVVMTIAQAYDYWSSATTGKATVVVSFDDTHSSDYTVVYPLFKARGLKGTSYIITGSVGESGSLTWDQIAKMRASTTSVMFQNGFESGSFSAWSGTAVSSGETAAVVNTRWHHGTYSARFMSNGGAGTEYAYCSKTVSSSSELYARGYFYVSRSGIVENSDRFYFIAFRAGANNVAQAGWTKTSGVTKWCLLIKSGTSTIIAYSSTVPSLNRWYRVELHWKKGTTAGLGELWVNGVRVCSITNKNTALYGDANQVRFGLPTISYCGSTTVYCDCTKIAKTYIGAE